MAGTTEEDMKQAELQVHRFMEWWQSGQGAVTARATPLLAAIDTSLLSELIAAGGGFHNILTPEKLDNLFTKYGSGSDPQLEPLRKALQSRGGMKSQARAVGTVLFQAAKKAFEGGSASGTAETSSVSCADAHALDETWSPPKKFVNTASFPAGAQIAARGAPNMEGTLLTTFPQGTDFFATGRKGDYIQIHYQDDVVSVTAYVPVRIGGTEILEAETQNFVPAAPAAPFSPPRAAVVASPPPGGWNPAASMSMSGYNASPLPACPPLPNSRVEVLEARVAQQDSQLLALQCDVADLKAQLAAVAAAFAPFNRQNCSRGGA